MLQSSTEVPEKNLVLFPAISVFLAEKEKVIVCILLREMVSKLGLVVERE